MQFGRYWSGRTGWQARLEREDRRLAPLKRLETRRIKANSDAEKRAKKPLHDHHPDPVVIRMRESARA